MTNYTEYIVTPNGLKRREFTEADMSLTPEFYSEMANYATFDRKNLIMVDGWGNAHCRMHKAHEFYSLAIDRIQLRCGWSVGESGIFTPNFHTDVEPRFEAVWKIPDTMRLIVLSRVNREGNDYSVETQWLLAFINGQPECYRLPLANIHDDGRLCDNKNGAGEYCGVTPALAILQAMNQFAQSGWNSDLWNTLTQTQAMFRFLAQSDQHIQQPPLQRWDRLCQVIAPDILNEVIQ